MHYTFSLTLNELGSEIYLEQIPKLHLYLVIFLDYEPHTHPCKTWTHPSFLHIQTYFSLRYLVLIDSVETFVLSHQIDCIVNICVAFVPLATILSSVWVKWSNLLPFPVSLPCILMLLLHSWYKRIQNSSQLGINLQKLYANESKGILVSETLLQWICLYVSLIWHSIP